MSDPIYSNNSDLKSSIHNHKQEILSAYHLDRGLSQQSTYGLPQELTDLIISQLESNDTESLAACALVGRSFLGASRSRLFQKITLVVGTEFYNLVASPSSSLASWVRCLQLVLNRPPFIDLHFLGRFKSAVSLHIETVSQGSLVHVTVYPSTPPFTHITILKLRGTRFLIFRNLMAFLRLFPAIQTLALMCLTWEGGASFKSHQALPASVETLTIFSNNTDILEWIVFPSLPLPRLATVIVGDVTSSDISTLYKFITAVSNTLQYLSVHFNRVDDEMEHLICAHPDLERIPQWRITRSQGMTIMKV